MYILLVEPDFLLGQLYRRWLQKCGHQVDWQQSAERAVASLDKQKADMIIVELQLPGHNGFEFLYEMRSYSDWQAIPVVIHSYIQPSKIINGVGYKELAIAKYLYKPHTSLADLEQALTSVVV